MAWDWFRSWLAIHDYRAMGRQEAERLSALETSPLRQAIRSVRAGDMVGANKYWEEARIQIPDHIFRSRDTIEVLLALERFEELEAIMRRARKAAPLGSHHILGLATLRQRQTRFPEAALLWKSLRRHSPMESSGYLEGAECLCHLKRLKEAMTVLRSGTCIFPENQAIWLKLAAITEALKDFPKALKVWDHIENELGLAAGFIGAARVCNEMGCPLEASKRLRDGRVRHPYDRDILVALAQLAERTQSPADALMFWREIRYLFPQWKTCYEETIRLLSQMGRAGDIAEVEAAWNSIIVRTDQRLH